ncbi:hypothetical protein EVG20_g8929, partial [Dentipellis fragilis]
MSYERRANPDSTYARRTQPPPQRGVSSPASAYFSKFVGENDDPQPTPDAQAHFAYSTTLRRQPAEGPFGMTPHSASFPGIESLRSTVRQEGAAGLWERLVNVVKGRPDDIDRLESAYAAMPKEEQAETPSARFAMETIEDTLAYYRTTAESGLSSTVIPSLRESHGYNEFSVSSPDPLWLKFAQTIYESPLILLLCGSALISAFMGNVDDAVSITVAILIVLTVGFIQERRSEKSLEALNKLVPHHCHVTRDGASLHVFANEVVPGDIVTFSTGDRVPADVRLISAVDLEIDESSLTGETTARSKNVDPCRVQNGVNGHASAHGYTVAMADRTCIAYMGTLVRNGRGSGVVIATGTQTEFGVIFSMMQDVEERRTPLQRSMDELAKKLSILSFGVIGVICLIGVLQSRSWLDMFTIGVSLAVAAIPEGLPIVTTVTLALGVLRMSKRKAIVKKLHSVEALGSVSVICSDKTGTLTRNEQTVTEMYAVDETVHLDPNSQTAPSRVSSALWKALEIGAICNNASTTRNEEGIFVGQATDVALLNVLSVFDMADPRPTFTRLSERHFSSEKKYMAVSGTHNTAVASSPSLAQLNGNHREVYYIKGSMDFILDRCKYYFVSEDSTPTLDASMRNSIHNKAHSTAARGLRVIGMAYGFGHVDDANSSPTSRSGSPSLAGRSRDTEKTDLIFVGFTAMEDPPRKGVADAIALLQSGGVQVVMITGDAEQTALSIARELGLRVPGAGSAAAGATSVYCLTGQQIDQM